jgi:hypothetical protein
MTAQPVEHQHTFINEARVKEIRSMCLVYSIQRQEPLRCLLLRNCGAVSNVIACICLESDANATP